MIILGLRALLIQKDVKLCVAVLLPVSRLRALLIQKDVKPNNKSNNSSHGLRALLIQKDVKLCFIRQSEICV